MNKINYKCKKGFTLVELIIFITILGVLIPAGINNYKMYRAKTMQFDAQIQLANIYKAEISAHADYHTYTTCLTSIDYSTPTDGYYLSGFRNDEATSINSINEQGGDCETGEYAPKPGIFRKISDVTPFPTPDAQLSLGNIKAATRTTRFTAAAAGNISSEVPYDIWTIDQSKKIKNITVGYKPI